MPLFSIVTPVYDPPLDVLEQTIESVLAQELDDWEWILVDDCSTEPGVLALLNSHAKRDERIKVIARETNGHIVQASNDAIEAAVGEFIVLLDHDDLLTPDALQRNATMIAQHDDVDYLYSDEDKVDSSGRHYDAFLKPSWSPARLRGQMYTAHLSVIRTELVRRIGGFREGYDGSQDHDLALRVTELARRIVHIPEILYHWRVVPGSAAGDPNAKPYAQIAGRQAVQDHVDRQGLKATVVDGPVPGTYTLQHRLDPDLRVSLVIPTLGKSALIWGRQRVLVVEAVRSMLATTQHRDIEVVVVYDAPTPTEVLDELREIAGDRLVLVPFTESFNYSRKMNLGIVHATGDRIVMLNDDVEVCSEGWLEALVGPLDEPGVGLTGGRLYFTNSTVQHAGHMYEGGNYHHAFIGYPRTSHGPFNALAIDREVSGVTGACAAMRRDVYFEVGGFTELLPGNFNDVDLSYKVRHAGYRIVWTAACQMYHFESVTRIPEVKAWEKDVTVGRWGRPADDTYLRGVWPSNQTAQP